MVASGTLNASTIGNGLVGLNVRRNNPATPILSLELPKKLFETGGKLEKVNNFEWFKANFVIRLVINANPFVAGRLYLSYRCSAPVLDGMDIYAKGRAGITSYPGVEIDLQSNTAAEIVIPWLSVADAMSLTRDSYNVVTVDLWALCPLVTPDAALGIPYRIYGWFKDVELRGPTPLKAVLQSSEAPGPITQISSGVSKVAGRLSRVPVIGTIASKVKWASDLVGGVASVFGWSRPIDGSNAQAVVSVPGRGFSQFTSKDTATVLGMSNDNCIAEDTQNFYADVDEMQVEYICGRPGLVSVLPWKTTDTFGSTLGVFELSPRALNSNQYVDGTVTPWRIYEDLPLCDYVIRSFAYWRADFVFRISVVKTSFHVGRLEVIFIPGTKIPMDGDLIDTTNAWKEVFDITERNEFEVVVPYMQQKVMCRSFEERTSTLPPDWVGFLVIRTETPLTAPSTVDQAVNILVWKSARNVVLNAPIIGFDIPSPPLPTDLNRENPTHDDDPDRPHPNLITEQTEVVQATLQISLENEASGSVMTAFGSENSPETCMAACTTVGGERCISLRHATRSHRLIHDETGPTSLLCQIDHTLGGYLGICSGIFAFYRGGLSYKVMSDGTRPIVSSLAATKDQGRDHRHPQHIAGFMTGVHEVVVPFYSRFRRALCNSKNRIRGEFLPTLNITAGTSIYVAGKDDLTFGFLMGAPIIVRND